jgi:hypothetical protein
VHVPRATANVLLVLLGERARRRIPSYAAGASRETSWLHRHGFPAD